MIFRGAWLFILHMTMVYSSSKSHVTSESSHALAVVVFLVGGGGGVCICITTYRYLLSKYCANESVGYFAVEIPVLDCTCNNFRT